MEDQLSFEKIQELKQDLIAIKNSLEDEVFQIQEISEQLSASMEQLNNMEATIIANAFDEFVSAGLIPGAYFRLMKADGTRENERTYKIVGIYPNGFFCVDAANPEKKLKAPVYLKNKCQIDRFRKIEVK